MILIYLNVDSNTYATRTKTPTTYYYNITWKRFPHYWLYVRTVTSGFVAKGPIMQSFAIFSVVSQNKVLKTVEMPVFDKPWCPYDNVVFCQAFPSRCLTHRLLNKIAECCRRYFKAFSWTNHFVFLVKWKFLCYEGKTAFTQIFKFWSKLISLGQNCRHFADNMFRSIVVNKQF